MRRHERHRIVERFLAWIQWQRGLVVFDPSSKELSGQRKPAGQFRHNRVRSARGGDFLQRNFWCGEPRYIRLHPTEY